jgi:hypothetical protein
MKIPFTQWSIGLFFSMFMLLSFQYPTENIPTQEHKFVQFLVKDLTSVEDSRAIDAFIRAQEGIYMSRTDPNTQICFVIFPSTSSYNKETFNQWFADFGYQIDCYREGLHGKDKVYSKEQFPCN